MILRSSGDHGPGTVVSYHQQLQLQHHSLPQRIIHQCFLVLDKDHIAFKVREVTVVK